MVITCASTATRQRRRVRRVGHRIENCDFYELESRMKNINKMLHREHYLKGGKMRRKYAEVTDVNEIIRIMSVTNVGRMATIDEEGYPYITPLNYIFHEGCVYFHCANKGEKLDNMTRDPKVCFEVDVPLAYLEVDFTPEKDPCCTHQYYHSVIIRGVAQIVPDGDKKTTVLNALVAKHEGNRDFPVITTEHAKYKACSVVEITPVCMTAKSDLAQNKSQVDRDYVVECLIRRGLPGDLEAVRVMGYKVEKNKEIPERSTLDGLLPK